MATVKQDYRLFLKEFDFCWACGRDGTYSSMPEDWFSLWTIDRAHIVNQPRVEDRRVICALCRLCHDHSHGKRIITASRPADWPRLQLHHLLWLKSRFDSRFYDRHFIQRHYMSRLPRALKPPIEYRQEFNKRRGEVLVG